MPLSLPTDGSLYFELRDTDEDDEPLGGDVLEAEEADRDGTATAEQLELLDRSEVKAPARRMNAKVRPVVQRAKRDLINRPERIDRRYRRKVVRDFIHRPRCEARPQHGRRQSRDRPVRRRGSSRATAPTRGDPEDPEPPGRSLTPRSRRRQHKGGRS